MAGILGALIGGGLNLAGAAIGARRNRLDNKKIEQAQQANTGILNNFETQYGGTFDPSIGTANAGAGLYADALGINGAEGNGRATSAFQTNPGYAFQMDQGLQGVTRAASAGGMLASGNTLTAAQQYGQGLANQEYGNWLGRLAPYVGEQTRGNENKVALGSLISTGRMENNNAGIDRLQSNVNNRSQNVGGFLSSAANLFGRAAGYKGY